MRVVASAALSLAVVGLLGAGQVAASPVGGAKTTVDVVVNEAVATTAAVQMLCGRKDITAVATGWVQFRELKSGRGARQQLYVAIFHLKVTVSTEAGATVTLNDVGPDRGYVVDEKDFVAVSGQSVTGTGIAGHTVFLDGVQSMQSAGADLCARIPA